MPDDPIKKAYMSYRRSKDDRIAHCKSRKAVGRFTNFAQEHTGLKSFEFAFVTARLGLATLEDSPTSPKGTYEFAFGGA
jgi:hypothetical protein